MTIKGKIEILGSVLILEIENGQQVAGVVTIRLPDAKPCYQGEDWHGVLRDSSSIGPHLFMCRGLLSMQVFDDYAMVYPAGIQVRVPVEQARAIWQSLGLSLDFDTAFANLAEKDQVAA